MVLLTVNAAPRVEGAASVRCVAGGASLHSPDYLSNAHDRKCVSLLAAGVAGIERGRYDCRNLRGRTPARGEAFANPR